MIKCDKCDKQIQSTVDVKHVMLYTDVNDSAIKMLREMDLCRGCYEKIYTLIYDFATFKEKQDG